MKKILSKSIIILGAFFILAAIKTASSQTVEFGISTPVLKVLIGNGVYDSYGYNRDGYDRDGYDRGGYDRDGYDRDGYDRRDYDRDGRYRYERRDDDRDNYYHGERNNNGWHGENHGENYRENPIKHEKAYNKHR